MTSPLSHVQLHLIQGVDDVLACREWASRSRSTPVAFDVETEGLVPQRDRLRLLQLGDKDHGWAFPFPWGGAAIEILKDLVEQNTSLAAHNSQFDHRFVEKWLDYNIPWYLVHDTMILAALADPTRPKGLKNLSDRLIDRNASTGQHLLHDGMKANGWTWGTVPYDYPPYWSYACLDPVLTCHIYEQLAPKVFGSADEAYDLERGVVPVLASMMDAGLLLDRGYTIAKHAELTAFAQRSREWLKTYYGVDSLMSAKQIAAAMASAGVEITERTNSGLPSVTKEVLDTIAKSPSVPEAARQLAITVLKTRHAEKMCGTYLENFLELAAADGRIRPSIMQIQARTGRMSCSDPNLQNLPRDDKIIRGCFIPAPGHVLISCDFSQVEMRIAAALSGDSGLIAAFKAADEGGQDFYSGLASELFGGVIEKSDPRRQAIKSMSYASLYGAGLAKQAVTAGVTVEQLRPIRQAFDERFPGLLELARAVQAEAMSNMATDPEGRPAVRTSTGRYLPGDDGRAYALLNYKVQSEAAEQLKRAIVNVAAAGLGGYARAPVHDELIFEVPAEDAEEVKRAITEAMTDTTRYPVAITCDAKIMPERWSKG